MQREIFLPLPQQDFEQELLQRRFSGGSQSYGGDSPRLSPCSSMGKLSKSDEQLSSMEQDSGQCSRNTSCETLGRNIKMHLIIKTFLMLVGFFLTVAHSKHYKFKDKVGRYFLEIKQ